jgi:hypothetical protein
MKIAEGSEKPIKATQRSINLCKVSRVLYSPEFFEFVARLTARWVVHETAPLPSPEQLAPFLVRSDGHMSRDGSEAHLAAPPLQPLNP